jgi:hypothetical protein
MWAAAISWYNRFTVAINRSVPDASWRILIHLIMIQSVLLPLYAAWFDHNFARWQPGHNHIYLGEVDLDHHHGENTDDHHHHERSASCVEDEIIFLPNSHTLGQDWVFVSPASMLLSLGDTPFFSLHNRLLNHLLLFIPPLDKPPQA